MSTDPNHSFDPECPHCRPAILDVQTGRPMPPDHPMMLKVMQVWHAASRGEQEAFFNVTVKNSRSKIDLLLVKPLMARIEAAMKAGLDSERTN